MNKKIITIIVLICFASVISIITGNVIKIHKNEVTLQIGNMIVTDISPDELYGHYTSYNIANEIYEQIKLSNSNCKKISFECRLKNASKKHLKNIRLDFDDKNRLPSNIIGDKIDVDRVESLNLAPLQENTSTYSIIVKNNMSNKQLISLLSSVDVVVVKLFSTDKITISPPISRGEYQDISFNVKGT